jgi:uncharacterized membrane protein YhfC
MQAIIRFRIFNLPVSLVQNQIFKTCVGFAVLIAVTVKSYILWDITQCRSYLAFLRDISPPSSV